MFENGIDFEIIDLYQSAEFPLKSKIGDVRDVSTLRATITGSVVVNLAAVHRDDVSDTREYWKRINGAINVSEVCEKLDVRK